MRYARAILWDPQPEPAGGAAALGASAAADDERRRGHLLGFMRRELGPARPSSPFDGRIGTRRQVAFAAVPLGPLHDAARSAGAATVNDAVLTVVAGGIRRWLEAHHGPLGTIRVRVPVSLHHEGDDPGNRDSFFSLGVPLAEPDAVARLRAVHAATAARKAGDDALTQDEMMQALARGSPALRALAARLEASPRAFAVAVSNVVGPRSPVTVLGAPVRGLYSLAEIGQRHAAGRGGVPRGHAGPRPVRRPRASSTTSRRWPRAPRPRRGRSSRPRDGRRRRGRPQAPGRAPGGRPGRGRRDRGAPRDRRAGGRAGARPPQLPLRLRGSRVPVPGRPARRRARPPAASGRRRRRACSGSRSSRWWTRPPCATWPRPSAASWPGAAIRPRWPRASRSWRRGRSTWRAGATTRRGRSPRSPDSTGRRPSRSGWWAPTAASCAPPSRSWRCRTGSTPAWWTRCATWSSSAGPAGAAERLADRLAAAMPETEDGADQVVRAHLTRLAG